MIVIVSHSFLPGKKRTTAFVRYYTIITISKAALQKYGSGWLVGRWYFIRQEPYCTRYKCTVLIVLFLDSQLQTVSSKRCSLSQSFFRTQEDDAFPYEESHEDQVPEIVDQSDTTWIRRENSGASGLRGVVLVSISTAVVLVSLDWKNCKTERKKSGGQTLPSASLGG
jgi:hypothetical protein